MPRLFHVPGIIFLFCAFILLFLVSIFYVLKVNIFKYVLVKPELCFCRRASLLSEVRNEFLFLRGWRH